MARQFIAILGCISVLALGSVNCEDASANPEVTFSLGKVKGSLLESRLGKKIYAFRGLRYAEGPIGPLRFKLAVPAKPWTNVFDASEEGPSCPRQGGQNKSDDCLRLNVYSTKLGPETKRPVIVFFHPGAFVGFSGQSYVFGPQYLMDEDIVLVTVNFRLGAIGFTATGDALSPGNLGLKDQVEALRWIQKNIAPFGGDHDSVTIVGYSAGAWSTALHMLSPMSKGLFHRAVSMSGSPTKPAPMPYEQTEIAKKQATLVGCPNDSTERILSCMEKVPHEKMVSTFGQFMEWHDNPIRVWGPVVEPDIPGVERFIVGQPDELIRQGKFHKVPYMAGTTRDEFASLARLPVVEARKGNNSIFDDLNENWDDIAPIIFSYERNTTKSKQISKELRDFYFKGEKIGLANWEKLGQLFSDSIVKFPVNRMVNLVAAHSDQPVYYYHFVYQGRRSYYVWTDTRKPMGVGHHDELMYLFFMKVFFPYLEPDAPEIPTVKHLTAMWASFAKTGNPIPRDNPLFRGIKWDRFTPENKKYLEINGTLTMKRNVNGARMEAFDRIFPLAPLKSKH
ncbi:esterase E4 [Diachasma alloeum]|uniref:esterase E4 n=1 Tax=Diachasma alloeum TaxID=454923 RepID=UPI0007382B89|nr:esterase E4 [Diachasma alloeum]